MVTTPGDDRRDRLMESLIAAAEARRAKQSQEQADQLGIAAEQTYSSTVEYAAAARFIRELNDDLNTIGPQLGQVAGRPVGGIPHEPTRTKNAFDGDNHDELMSYRISQMELDAKACRQYVSAQVRRVSDGSLVFAREFGPEDIRGKAYEANLSGLAWDFARTALDL